MRSPSPQDWKQLEQAFDGAMDQPPEKRETWLREHCDGDHELFEQVKALLQAESESSELLGPPVVVSASDLVAEGLADPLLGSEIGRYRIVEEIGYGGMGVVYAAERHDGQFDQAAVIKILRAGLDTEQARRRFRLERQILANLDHPNIARLLDGGVTPDGRPYIVMERVPGTRIDLYCDMHRLTVRDRLGLFMDVADAVEFAHRNLIVHRDLKPSNVLVTEDGRAKLLDFGIAKILDHSQTDRGLTGTEMQAMTPEYASPEQVRQEAITTSSDVYQLGVLLYELLTGQPPYPLDGRSPLEIGRTICEKEPTLPSRAVTSSGRNRKTENSGANPPEDVGQARRTSLPRLRRELGGDLDKILLMTLRKEPSRRYRSVQDLREDLRRYLAGEPVRARADSLRYRSEKFVRRNWITVTAAAMLLIISSGFAVLYTLRVTRARTTAEREAAQRQEISEFLVDLFRVSGGVNNPGDEITARELLARGRERVESGEDEEDVRARLLEVLGEVHLNLGMIDPAKETLEEASGIYRRLYGPHSPELRRVLSQLAGAYSLERNFAASASLLEEVLATKADNPKWPEPERAEILIELAAAHRETDQPIQAREEMEEAIEILRRHYAPDSSEVIAARGMLAFILRGLGENEDAEQIYREVLEQLRSSEPTPSADLAKTLNNLGYLVRLKGNYAESASIYEEAVAASEAVHGEAHPTTLLLRQNLAGSLHFDGRVDEALMQLEAILRLRAETLPEDHWRIGSANYAIGTLLARELRPEEAEDRFTECVRIYRKSLGPDHAWTANAEAWLAATWILRGRTRDGDRLLARVEPILLNEDSQGYGQVPRTLDFLNDVFRESGDAERAQHFENLLARYRAGGEH